MPNIVKLPRGIQNNNPGNLRHAVIPECPAKVIDGFAVFTDINDGLWNLAHLCRSKYVTGGKRTPFDFMMSYAPPNENKTLEYIAFVARWVRCAPGAEKTFDIKLDEAWRLMDWMRGIIIFENGWPPPAFSQGGEWFNAQQLAYATDRAALI